MKLGDMIRIDDSKYSFLSMREDPPEFMPNTMKGFAGRFECGDLGIVLERRRVHSNTYPYRPVIWIRLLCLSGIGWIKKCDLDLVR